MKWNSTDTFNFTTMIIFMIRYYSFTYPWEWHFLSAMKTSLCIPESRLWPVSVTSVPPKTGPCSGLICVMLGSWFDTWEFLSSQSQTFYCITFRHLTTTEKPDTRAMPSMEYSPLVFPSCTSRVIVRLSFGTFSFSLHTSLSQEKVYNDLMPMRENLALVDLSGFMSCRVLCRWAYWEMSKWWLRMCPLHVWQIRTLIRWVIKGSPQVQKQFRFLLSLSQGSVQRAMKCQDYQGIWLKFVTMYQKAWFRLCSGWALPHPT